MEILDSYLEVMESQNVLYGELLDLAKIKQPVLINGEIKKLENVTKKEQNIIIQVGRLEEKRITLHQALANHFCIKPEELNAKKFAELVKDDYRSKVQDITESLQKIVFELEKLNSANTALLEQSLEYVNFSLNLLTGFDNNPTYGVNEEDKIKTTAKIFDRKL